MNNPDSPLKSDEKQNTGFENQTVSLNPPKLDEILEILKEQLANGGVSAAELEGEDMEHVVQSPVIKHLLLLAIRVVAPYFSMIYQSRMRC